MSKLVIDNKKRALELRKALEYFVATLDIDTEESKILEIPSMFPVYKVGVNYKIKDIFSKGTNAVGDVQLYQVLQDHTSQADWLPENTPSLYKAIGINANGIPEWVQPLGASDAYNTGEQVMRNGKLCTSKIDGNVWDPEVCPEYWDIEE